ncbi:hypothetical protein PS880_04288 [Pseudomonas fluorescens]|uniref:Uncharacterized protein n=1 Tax=Pseudomonas fluorescens TaxID=294 RepID=A0A5E7MYN9_PSEFL|nr:hypothetical protein PS880_04288 [Pseudomonas fluorescens]
MDVEPTALELRNTQRPDRQIEIQLGMTATVNIEAGQHSTCPTYYAGLQNL